MSLSPEVEIVISRAQDYIAHITEGRLTAVYLTGSTANGNIMPYSDVDFLAVVDSDKHSSFGYAHRVWDNDAKKLIDIVLLTRKDLSSPATVLDYGNDKLSYLIREADRKRILIQGRDVFYELINRAELEQLAKRNKLDSGTMGRMKMAIEWE